MKKIPEKEKPKAADISEIEFDASHLIQFIPKFEELPIIDLKEYDQRAFSTFLSEIEQPIKNDQPVIFSGQLQKGKKEGKGGYKYPNGDFYYGGWLND